jgi:hypothetical protein
MLVLVGCAAPPAPAPDEDLGHTADAIIIGNDQDLNGKDVNGKDVNGKDVNGKDVNGKDVNGKDVNGKDVNGVKLEAGNITALSSDNELLSGESLLGATFDGKLIDGTPIRFRIDAVDDFNWHSPLPAGYPADPVYAYTISVKYGGQHDWSPICGKDHGQPRRTTPLAGRWNYEQGVAGGGDFIDDPDAVTFACEGYALYKCVALGYAPWVTFNGHDLADHHQTCTRLMRADYCGDGRSWTKDGIWINLYDDISIQHDVADWTIEAEWTPEGARCLTQRRIQSKKHAMPDCNFELPAASCGAPPHWTDTLLVNEFEED